MKKSLLLLLSVFTIMNACKKDDNTTDPPPPDPYKCTTCITTPEAKAEYNNSSAGVYKGVIVGSTGTIALYLHNTGTEVSALVSFDGKNATLTCSALSSWTPGQPITNAVFTGVVDGQAIEATFSVEANGQNPSVQVNIPGHTVTVAIYKETSTAMIRNFEGTYTGGSQGIFNMVIVGDEYSIVSPGTLMPGTLVNGKVDYNSGSVEVKGEFNGTDQISGTWKNNSDNTEGTWSGNRTL